MDFDFSIILIVLTLVSGLVWLLDHLFFAPRRRQRKEAVAEPIWVEYSRSFFPVLLIVLIVRSFLIEPFQIPSQSMEPTLLVGDFILVSKFEYGLRVPVLGARMIDIGEPERGDVMVFRNPEDNFTNFIKRVVGLPGDRLQYRNGQLRINGEVVPERFLAGFPPARPVQALYEEQLGDQQHRILKHQLSAEGQAAGEGEWVVPEGHYFVLGDNRDRSRDSRWIGMVPDSNIVGRAFAIWMHWESWFSLPSFSRVGAID